LADLLQEMALEREISDQPLEFAVLLAQLPQLANSLRPRPEYFFCQT
jgi:hypothetical protein